MQSFKFHFECAEINNIKLVTVNSLLLLLYTALEKAENEQEKSVVRLLIKGISEIKYTE